MEVFLRKDFIELQDKKKALKESFLHDLKWAIGYAAFLLITCVICFLLQRFDEKYFVNKMTEKTPCKLCGIEILPVTSENNRGFCEQCKEFLGNNSIASNNPVEIKGQFDGAFSKLSILIDQTFRNCPEKNVGVIGDALFEGVRIYSCAHFKPTLFYDDVTELAEGELDEIESLFTGGSLFKPLLSKLESISKEMNDQGKLIFLASWGMGEEEIGSYVYHLNSRKIYNDFIKENGFSDNRIKSFYEEYKHEF